MTYLDKLIVAVEGGDDSFISEHEYANTRIGYVNAATVRAAYCGGLDAAKAIHEALLPGWFPGLSQNIHNGYWYAWVQDKYESQYSEIGDNPARAWLIAILKAYRRLQ